VRAFSELGLWKIRLTGGEPTVRKDFIEIAQGISNLPGVRKLALSTNAYQLAKDVEKYKEVGISALNISIDSLDSKLFHQVTGHDRLKSVLDGIDKALALDFATIKTNTVLMKDFNDEGFDLFMNWIKDKPISARFIELMLTGDNQDFYKKHHLKMSVLYRKLIANGWSEISRKEADGPARSFSHPDYKGTIGCISPYAQHFCDTCNRLRVTSFGKLRLCLFSNGEDFSLRNLLQSDDQKEELQETIVNVLMNKKQAHNLHEDDYGSTRNFSSMGG
jgi:cyclic pyranopterin phosphate synthase